MEKVFFILQQLIRKNKKSNVTMNAWMSVNPENKSWVLHHSKVTDRDKLKEKILINE